MLLEVVTKKILDFNIKFSPFYVYDLLKFKGNSKQQEEEEEGARDV